MIHMKMGLLSSTMGPAFAAAQLVVVIDWNWLRMNTREYAIYAMQM